MCENYEDPSESRKTQTDGRRTTAELDSSVFNGESPVQISERTRALRCDTWEKFFDKDGRVVNESALRKAVFKGNFFESAVNTCILCTSSLYLNYVVCF